MLNDGLLRVILLVGKHFLLDVTNEEDSVSIDCIKTAKIQPLDIQEYSGQIVTHVDLSYDLSSVE